MIDLSGHTITITLPLRLCMVEIRRDLDGFTLMVVHESGWISNSELIPISGYALSDANAHGDAAQHQVSPSVLPEEYLATFPMVSTMDLRNLPAQFYGDPAGIIATFEFAKGERYHVSVVGSLMIETVVIVH